ncbi:hypothetical protein DL762_000274 [Monosporascus cannonballus]|uniref:Uncharacterized protein n=1 Tax=Monosporascus cannonballus TaxID=155416 RepID=A0ABY0HLV0_9PEZI|nr:hypothetical protein DL763_008285 [Monosporascus cannonballus]RYO95081.1 hypothetical protein DL762_000274 [Monosporascus cannonballus]
MRSTRSRSAAVRGGSGDGGASGSRGADPPRTRKRGRRENEDEDGRQEPEPDADPNLAADGDDDDDDEDSEAKGKGKRKRVQIQEDVADDAISAEFPAVSLEELAERLPKAEDSLDDIWTAEKEEELQASLVDDAYYQYAMNKGPPKTDRRYWTMWRKVCRMVKCFPTDIIGAKQDLRYAQSTAVLRQGFGGTTFEGATISDPNWSWRFAEPLSALALGSPCRDNVDLLAFFVRYAVACRTNDRRRYRTRTRNIPCVFLRELAALVARTDGNDPMVELHAGLRRKWTAGGRHIPDSSEVLLEIEQRSWDASVPERRAGEDEESFALYSVLTEDLTSVLEAFKNTRHKGLRMYPDPQESAAVLWNAVERDDLGRLSLQDWNVLRGPLIVEEMRFLRKRRLSEQPGLAGPEEGAEEEQDAGAHQEVSRKTMPRGTAGLIMMRASSENTARMNYQKGGTRRVFRFLCLI